MAGVGLEKLSKKWPIKFTNPLQDIVENSCTLWVFVIWPRGGFITGGV